MQNNKTFITIITISALLAFGLFSISSLHASEITGTLSSGGTTGGSTATGTISGGSGSSSTITGTVTGGSTATGTISGGSGGSSTISGTVVGVGSGGGGGGGFPVVSVGGGGGGLVLGTSSVDYGTPNTTTNGANSPLILPPNTGGGPQRQSFPWLLTFGIGFVLALPITLLRKRMW